MPEEDRHALKAIHWELIRSDINNWYDRMAHALRIKDRARTGPGLWQHRQSLGCRRREANKRKKDLEKTGVGDAGQIVAKEMGMVLIALNAAFTPRTIGPFDRAEQIRRQPPDRLRPGRVLCRSGPPSRQAQRASLPSTLPRCRTTCSPGKPLTYRPNDKGYLFYSIGENKQDEEGRSFDDNPKGTT